MPTFNQLVRKGREVLVKKEHRACPSEELQLPEKGSTPTSTARRSVVSALPCVP